MQSFEQWTANDCFEFCVESFEKLYEGSVISAKMIVKNKNVPFVNSKCIS